MTDQTRIIFEESIRINSYDCDLNGDWKPAAFFQRMTEAAHIHADKLGVGYDQMIQRNLTWVLSRLKIKFLRFPKIDETITIRTWPKTIQQRLFFIRDFEISDTLGETIARASSAWLVIKTSTRSLVPPRALDFALPSLEDRHGLVEPLEKLDPIQGGEERLLVQARYSDIDIVGHTNNSHYIEWICDAFPVAFYREQRLDWIQVNYNHEILPDEQVSIRTKKMDDDNWGIQGFNLTNQSVAFEAALHWKAHTTDNATLYYFSGKE